jgi:hypothetical protein
MKPPANADFPELIGYESAPEPSSDRLFGVIFAILFAAIALAPLRRGAPIRAWMAVIATLWLAVALLRPAALAPLNKLWQRFGAMLQTVTNPIVMAILFASTIVPFGFIMRLFGRDALKLQRSPGLETYWIARNPPGPPPQSMKDQF